MQRKIYYFITSLIMLSLNISIMAQGVDPGTENLTHSWTFNDGTANDYISGAHGELMGDAEVFDGLLFLPTLGSYVELPAQDIGINTYEEVTLEIWFTPVMNTNTGYHMLAFFGNTVSTLGNDYYFITSARGDDSSRAAISVGVEATPWTGESGANGPEYDDGELHHMVSTINATDITLYIDGELQATTPLDSNNSIEGISTMYAYLAKGGYEADPTWQGDILEFNIYDKALSADEILFLFNRGASTTEIKDENKIPNGYSLLQNYPNPFNPSTNITFSIGVKSFVSLKIFDQIGNEVATIINNELPAGSHTRQWYPDNIASGVYFYRIQAGEFTSTKKLVLIR